jgi:hypothetical protein
MNLGSYILTLKLEMSDLQAMILILQPDKSKRNIPISCGPPYSPWFFLFSWTIPPGLACRGCPFLLFQELPVMTVTRETWSYLHMHHIATSIIFVAIFCHRLAYESWQESHVFIFHFAKLRCSSPTLLFKSSSVLSLQIR